MSRPRLWHRVELGVGILFGLAIVLVSGTRALLRAWLTVAFHQAGALVPLLTVDGAGTAASFGRMLARLGLAILPSLFLIRAAPPRRRVWLIAALTLGVVFTSPVSLASCETAKGWLLLVALSTLATLLVRRRVPWMGWTIVLPFVVLLAPMPPHVLAARRTSDEAFRRKLLTECAGRAGERPSNLTPDRIKPPHAVSAVDDELLLLTGQGPKDDVMFGVPDGRPGSWWLRRQEGRLVFEQPSQAEGRLWRACLLDGRLWTAQAARLVGVRRVGGGEEVTRVFVPGHDIDMGDTACDPVRRRVYVGEATRGGMWELNPDNQQWRRREIGLPALLPMRRFDGRIVINSSSSLNVYSPEEKRVVERVPSALLSVGFDLCSSDGAAAVADETGRLRVFTLAEGRYRFAWALPLFAPRRAAWSRDCSRIAVTSSDDHSVYIVDAAAGRVLEVLQVGPALREVTATGPREFSVTDACAVTSHRW